MACLIGNVLHNLGHFSRASIISLAYMITTRTLCGVYEPCGFISRQHLWSSGAVHESVCEKTSRWASFLVNVKGKGAWFSGNVGQCGYFNRVQGLVS